MPIDYTATAQDLSRIDEDAHDHFDLISAGPVSSQVPQNALLCVWGWKSPCNTDLFSIHGMHSRSVHRADLNEDEIARKEALETSILDRMGTIAGRMRKIPILDHDHFTIVIQVYRDSRTPYPKLEMLIDGHPLHSRALALPALVDRMRCKLEPLRDIPASGPFIVHEIGDCLVYAPDHERAVLKHAAFCETKSRGSRRP
jgi:hypothetical protein